MAYNTDTTGNAATSTKLSTARTVQTNLASTSTASFDGSANITPGVTGTLPIANGGSGQTTAAAAITALTGTQTAGRYLRSDGTNAALAAIQAADVPTLTADKIGPNYYLNSYVSGNYYFCNSGGDTSTIAHTLNSVRVSAWIVTSTITVTKLFFEYTAAGDSTSQFRVGVWNDDGTGKPSTLVVDGGATATNGTPGVYEVTISTTLTPGLYWVGGATQNSTTTNPTLRTVHSRTVPTWFALGTALPSAGAIYAGWAQSGVSGAFGTLSSPVLTGTFPARIGFKVS